MVDLQSVVGGVGKGGGRGPDVGVTRRIASNQCNSLKVIGAALFKSNGHRLQQLSVCDRVDAVQERDSASYLTITTRPRQPHWAASLDRLWQGSESNASADGGDERRAQKEGLCEMHVLLFFDLVLDSGRE